MSRVWPSPAPRRLIMVGVLAGLAAVAPRAVTTAQEKAVLPKAGPVLRRAGPPAMVVRMAPPGQARLVEAADDRERLLGSRAKGFVGCGGRRREALPLVAMTAAEAVSLGDPFGERVFRAAPTTDRVSRILELLRAGADNPHRAFVVSEWVKQADPLAGPPARRCVVAFTRPPLDQAVMLSASFTSGQFPEQLRSDDLLEVWGWDEARGVFNYYEWAETEWVLVGSTPTPADPQPSNRCLACHRSGVPVMKELRQPWANWESFESPNGYLRPGGAGSWAVTANGLPPVDDGANLEGLVMSAIVRANDRAVGRRVAAPPAGGPAVASDVKELLRPLFTTREFNLVSSRTSSRLGLADPPFQPQQGTVVEIPNSFFLNATLIAGGDRIGGLGVAAANGFAKRTKLPDAQYAALIRDPLTPLKLSPTGRLAGVRSGLDATFAWLTPERAFVDDHHVQVLLNRGVVTREFVAAALLVDLRRPVFSADLAQVFETPGLFPDTITVPATPPADHKTHPLTAHTLGRLAQLAPTADTPLGRLKASLDLGDPVGELTTRVMAYRTEIEGAFAAAGGPDQTVVKRLFGELLVRRRQVSESADLQFLDETREGGRSLGLLPLP